MNRNIGIILAAVLIVAFGSVYFLMNGASSGPSDEVQAEQSQNATRTFSWTEFPEFKQVLQPENRQEFLTPHATDKAFGDSQAPVVVMEFFSYQCSHCRSFHQGSFQRIMTDYVDTGLVYFVKRDFLLNDQSVGFELLAGAGAQCLSTSSDILAFADNVFEQQHILASTSDPVDSLVPVFGAVGLDETRARECMLDHRNQSLVLLRSQRSKAAAQVTGTPTIFINGERYLGSYSDYASLRQSIELALAAAN